jgi:hypothetical protein
MPQPLYPHGKSPWYPLDRRLGGPKWWSGHSGEEKSILIIIAEINLYVEQLKSEGVGMGHSLQPCKPVTMDVTYVVLQVFRGK